MARTYTIREAAALTTKSYAALRGMVDRGQLEATGGGKPGRTRRITHDELKRAGILRTEGLLAESAAQELSLQLGDLATELQNVEARLSRQLTRIETLLTLPETRPRVAPDDEPGLRVA